MSAAIRRLGIAVADDVNPLEVLARVLGVAAGDLETLREAVAEVEVHDPDHPVVRLYMEALHRAGRLAKVAADTHLAERMADPVALLTRVRAPSLPHAVLGTERRASSSARRRRRHAALGGRPRGRPPRRSR